MTVAGQNISSAVSLDVAAKLSNTVARNDNSSANNSDKSLINKEFTDIMDEQSASRSEAEETTANTAATHSEPDKKSQTQGPSEDSGDQSLSAEDGSQLPVSGEKLPVMVVAESLHFTSEYAAIVQSINASIRQIKGEFEEGAAPTGIADADLALNPELESAQSQLAKSEKAVVATISAPVAESPVVAEGPLVAKTPAAAEAPVAVNIPVTAEISAVTGLVNNIEGENSVATSRAVNLTPEQSAAQRASILKTTTSTTSTTLAAENTAQTQLPRESEPGLQLIAQINNMAARSQSLDSSAPSPVIQETFSQLTAQWQKNNQFGDGLKSGEGFSSELSTLGLLAEGELQSAVKGQSAKPASLVAPQLESTYRQSTSATLPVSTPIDTTKPGWSDGVMQKVMWMSSQNINSASINLDPPELGALQVKISTQGDQTSISFTSSHGAVRDALDQGLPKLREMMEDQGVNLADVDVSDQRSFERQSEEEGEDSESLANSGAGSSEEASTEDSLLHQTRETLLGLVDQYV